jgi:hypothetical protein
MGKQISTEPPPNTGHYTVKYAIAYTVHDRCLFQLLNLTKDQTGPLLGSNY